MELTWHLWINYLSCSSIKNRWASFVEFGWTFSQTVNWTTLLFADNFIDCNPHTGWSFSCANWKANFLCMCERNQNNVNCIFDCKLMSFLESKWKITFEIKKEISILWPIFCDTSIWTSLFALFSSWYIESLSS